VRREISDLGSAKPNRVEGVLEAELEELAYRVRLQIDADPEGLEPRHRLVHPAAQTDLMQAEREAEAADSGSSD